MSEHLSIMVEAKREYLDQLCTIMCPPMIEVFDELYKEAVKTSKRDTLLKNFKFFSRKYQTGPMPCPSDTVIT